MLQPPGPCLRSMSASEPPPIPEHQWPEELPADQLALLAEFRHLLEALEVRLARRLEQSVQIHHGHSVCPTFHAAQNCAQKARLNNLASERAAPNGDQRPADATCEVANLESELNLQPGPEAPQVSKIRTSSRPPMRSTTRKASSPNLSSQTSSQKNSKSTRRSHSMEDMDRKKSARHFAGLVSATANYPTKFGNQRRVEAIVSSPQFEVAFAILILLSSFSIGLEVEYTANNRGEPRAIAFFWADVIFTVIFLVELVMRIWAMKRSFFGRDNLVWGCLDTLLVGSSVIDILVETFVLLDLAGSAGAGDFNQIRLVRVLRITRAVRTLRVTRLIRFIASLRILVASIIATLQSLTWALLLLLIIVYAVGVVFTEATNAYFLSATDPIAEKYWGNLPLAMFTLFKCISGGVSWHDVVEPLYNISLGLVVLFTLYIAFTTFAVLNVLTGVFCQSAIETVNRDPDLVAQSVHEQKKSNLAHLERLFDTMDTKGIGHIDFPQFEHLLMTSSEMQAYLAALGVQTDDAWAVFKLIDVDCDHGMDREEFVSGMLRLQGTATSVDIQTVLESQRWISKRLSTLGMSEHSQDA